MSAIEDVAKQLQAETASDIVESALAQPQGRRGFKAWFHDLPLAGKIRAVFGSFLLIMAIMSLVLGIGLAQLYERYQLHAEVQGAVQASADLRSINGELRYNSVRYVLGSEQAALERQQESFAKARERIEGIGETIDRRVPEFSGRVDELGATMAAYNAKFEELRANLAQDGRNGRSTALASELSVQGDALFALSSNFEQDLSLAASRIEQSGLDYFFNMIKIFIAVTALAAAVMVFGLRYLSRDFAQRSRK
ncbi:hypothetical protein G6N82_11165 [Altererythrobacter sp. BO-6]|uniref:hypothetical protein n=1 Tax=Altererythrobacter sp. BO-6 TaxID=2604537 RepID=UPI0013E0F927|nr:hypothetical protein [Altererythrobacter sp. BO-6]QIG54636.1 hypothetical protein G6N82_11165 [Altererythrobacter sp. BO-6]